MKHIITAKRSNGETLFFLSNDSQGARMLPNAQSLASQFDSKAEALTAIETLRSKWKGLLNWTAEKLVAY